MRYEPSQAMVAKEIERGWRYPDGAPKSAEDLRRMSPYRPERIEAVAEFRSAYDFAEFEIWLGQQVRKGRLEQILLAPSADIGLAVRHFLDRETGQVWELFEPAEPFGGSFQVCAVWEEFGG